MDLMEAMEARHSVRQYDGRPLDPLVGQALRKMIEKVNFDSGLHIQLVTDEPKAFDGVLARYGNFVGVSNYLAMIGKKGPKLDECIGYYGEMLVLGMQRLGLNSCWAGLTFTRQPEVLQIERGEKLSLVIAIGYGLNQGKPHLSKTPDQVSENWQQSPDWFKDGVRAALLAPTAVNQQKFRFSCEGNVVAVKPGSGFFSKVDMGIAKYHFQLGAGKDNFTWAK
jgi:nitroreductase